MDPTLAKRSWNILGTTYVTKWVDDLRSDDGLEISGQIDLMNKEIHLCKSLLDDVGSSQGFRHAIKTLLHELLHGVQEESGIVQCDLDDDLFEVMAETQANFLVNSFRLEPIEND